MYLGLQALSQADPDDPSSHLLLERFQGAARQFPMGLLAVQSAVNSGDISNYGAFFTKGVAFWAEIDSALRMLGSGSLTTHLRTIWAAKYDHAGQPPPDFGTELGLPEATWKRLVDDFLSG